MKGKPLVLAVMAGLAVPCRALECRVEGGLEDASVRAAIRFDGLRTRPAARAASSARGHGAMAELAAGEAAPLKLAPARGMLARGVGKTEVAVPHASRGAYDDGEGLKKVLAFAAGTFAGLAGFVFGVALWFFGALYGWVSWANGDEQGATQALLLPVTWAANGAKAACGAVLK